MSGKTIEHGCPDCDGQLVEVDSPETAGPQSWECEDCRRMVDTCEECESAAWLIQEPSTRFAQCQRCGEVQI